MRPLPTLTLLAATLLAPPSFGEVSGEARASASTGIDTNARRDYDTSLNGLDVVGNLQVDLGGRLRTARTQTLLNYSAGARKFARLSTEDIFVQAAALDASALVTQSATFGLLGLAKDRRGASRDYTDLQAFGVIEFFPDDRMEVRVRGGAHRFLYRPNIQFSFGAAEAGGTAMWRFDKRHAVFVFGEFGDRTYLMDADPPPGEQRSSSRRLDRVLGAGLGYEYRGPVRVRADYSFFEQNSNSFGQSSSRHRLSALFAARLFFKLNLVSQAALQITDFPDGILLSPEIVLLEDEENSNSLSVKLVRALTDKLDAELRYAVYYYRLSGNDLSYLRQVGWCGLSFHL